LPSSESRRAQRCSPTLTALRSAFPPADRAAVFAEFRRVGAAAKEADGRGLGLAPARKVIDLHGGRIWVKRDVGAGSTFTFALLVRGGE
jgi:signal transduction histidine kinase